MYPAKSVKIIDILSSAFSPTNLIKTVRTVTSATTVPHIFPGSPVSYCFLQLLQPSTILSLTLTLMRNPKSAVFTPISHLISTTPRTKKTTNSIIRILTLISCHTQHDQHSSHRGPELLMIRSKLLINTQSRRGQTNTLMIPVETLEMSGNDMSNESNAQLKKIMKLMKKKKK